MSTKKGGSLKYFSEDSTGFKIQPKTVLIMSLVYIGLVVLLHIYSKVNTPVVKAEGPTDQAGEESQEKYKE
jgi:protein transport protein SEC61 subunit beta